MHEMALAENVVQIVQDAARREKFGKVKMVRLEIGQLSGVEPGSLRFCFDVVVKNTVIEGAELQILEVEGKAHCQSCGKDVCIRNRYDGCPECGEVLLQVTGGTEMRIKDLQVE